MRRHDKCSGYGEGYDEGWDDACGEASHENCELEADDAHAQGWAQALAAFLEKLARRQMQAALPLPVASATLDYSDVEQMIREVARERGTAG